MQPYLHAERALLGALLLAPAQVGEVADWLTPEHFGFSAHGVLYRHLVRRHAAGHPAVRPGAGEAEVLAWFNGALADGAREPDGRALTVGYGHALVSACPNSRHAAVYGRMVLGSAIHRTVTEHATRLHQAAHGNPDPDRVRPVLDQVDILTEVLTDLQQRWAPLAPTEPAASSAPQPGRSAPTGTPTQEQLADEQWLLALLIDTPEPLAELAGWLEADDFADPLHQRLYQCLLGLHHRREVIDPLTVLWEAQRRGFLPDAQDTPEHILALGRGGPGGDPAWYVEQIVRHTILRNAVAAAEQISDLAAAAPPTGRLILGALAALAPLQHARQRWQTLATGNAPTTADGPGDPHAAPAAAAPATPRHASLPTSSVRRSHP